VPLLVSGIFCAAKSRWKVKKATGTQTGKAGNTHLGAAKPDDPVFKEGWTVTMWPGVWQQSPKPSDSTQGKTYPRPTNEPLEHLPHLTSQEQQEDEEAATRRYSRPRTKNSTNQSSMPSKETPNKACVEADESENVMRDPMTGEAIRCQYCKSAEVCPHMLFLINWDFPGNVEGYCANRLGEFREPVEKAFLDLLQGESGSDWLWSTRELNDLWYYARTSFRVGDTTVAFDGVVVAQLIIDMFDRVGGEKYSRSVENAPGPGLSSVWTLYYAKNPAAVMDAALSELKKLLVPEVKADRSRKQKRGTLKTRRSK
jgi:hypothetical protein